MESSEVREENERFRVQISHRVCQDSWSGVFHRGGLGPMTPYFELSLINWSSDWTLLLMTLLPTPPACSRNPSLSPDTWAYRDHVGFDISRLMMKAAKNKRINFFLLEKKPWTQLTIPCCRSVESSKPWWRRFDDHCPSVPLVREVWQHQGLNTSYHILETDRHPQP